MSWVKVEVALPRDGVDVHVVTQFGVKGTAKYFELPGKWFTQMDTMPDDYVIRWRYGEALRAIHEEE